MHKVRTPWPTATRVGYIVSFEECRRRWRVSARHFCSATEIPYSTFARWWARWQRGGNQGPPAPVCRALPALLKTFPFPLRCIQTDNGSEFGLDLTALLKRSGIRHTRIRPRSPHLPRQGGAGAAYRPGGVLGRDRPRIAAGG